MENNLRKNNMHKDTNFKYTLEQYKAINLSLRDQNIVSLRNIEKDIRRILKTGLPTRVGDRRIIKMCLHFAVAELYQSEMDMLDI